MLDIVCRAKTLHIPKQNYLRIEGISTLQFETPTTSTTEANSLNNKYRRCESTR
jgi:hypothetical protein